MIFTAITSASRDLRIVRVGPFRSHGKLVSLSYNCHIELTSLNMRFTSGVFLLSRVLAPYALYGMLRDEQLARSLSSLRP